MNRRDFLSTIVAIPLVKDLLRFSVKEQAKDHFYYKGWEVKWLGWHLTKDRLHYYGLYLAKLPTKDDVAYAYYPGPSGIATFAAAISTENEPLKGQQIVCLHNDNEDLMKYQVHCRTALFKVIDDYCPKLV